MKVEALLLMCRLFEISDAWTAIADLKKDGNVFKKADGAGALLATLRKAFSSYCYASLSRSDIRLAKTCHTSPYDRAFQRTWMV
jgi:hypothetical protein